MLRNFLAQNHKFEGLPNSIIEFCELADAIIHQCWGLVSHCQKNGKDNIWDATWVVHKPSNVIS